MKKKQQKNSIQHTALHLARLAIHFLMRNPGSPASHVSRAATLAIRGPARPPPALLSPPRAPALPRSHRPRPRRRLRPRRRAARAPGLSMRCLAQSPSAARHDVLSDPERERWGREKRPVAGADGDPHPRRRWIRVAGHGGQHPAGAPAPRQECGALGPTLLQLQRARQYADAAARQDRPGRRHRVRQAHLPCANLITGELGRRPGKGKK